MPQTVSRILRTSFNGRWTSGRQVVNVMHWYVDENVPAVSRNDVLPLAAEDIRNAWQDRMVRVFVNNYSFDSLSWVDLNSADGATGSLAANGALPFVGTDVATSLPVNVAVLVTKRIVGSRTSRSGRIYLPPVSETEVDEAGVIAAGRVTAHQNALNSFRTDANTSALAGPLGTISLRTVSFPNGEDQVGESHVVNGLDLESVVATQRRRLRG